MSPSSTHNNEQGYRGRFAPSPTGPLHFGSLVAATASYLDARSHSGSWIVRMEDLDRERVQIGADDVILADLEHFGFTWDGPVLWQSRRTEVYQEAFNRLQREGLVYPCACSRKEVADSAAPNSDTNARGYTGTCARGLAPGRIPRSWRVRTVGEVICFEDRMHGLECQNVEEAVGDFVLMGAKGQFAYQLAVVVDDDSQEITDVVRGADLLDSTPRQIYLQRLLGFATPNYMHIPVATDSSGNKLSKQNHAPALDRRNAGSLICSALDFLRLAPPKDLHEAPVSEIWQWAISVWSIGCMTAH